MSGICGIYSPRLPSRASPEILERMLRAIVHRGTAGSSAFVDRERGIALGCTRRAETRERPSIPDSVDGERVGVLDGELLDLDGRRSGEAPRREAGGSSVQTLNLDSDRELERLSGHFAWAIWDKGAHSLWLLRDALGTKPLYYAHCADDGLLLFASEPKGILAHPSCRRSVDREALSAFLTFGYVPAPLSIFDGIRKVFPGEILKLDAWGRLTHRQYWKMPRHEPREADLETLAARTREHVLSRFEAYVHSDKRVGLFLSGGVDSTIALGILKLLGVPELHTFTLGFRTDPRLPWLAADLDFAQRVADRFGSVHHPIVLEAGHDPSPRLPLIWRQFDEPMVTPNVYSKYLLSEAARRCGVSLCLSGLGVENLFAVVDPRRIERLRTKVGARASDLDLMIERYNRFIPIAAQSELLADCPSDPRDVAVRILERYSHDVEADWIGDRMVVVMMRMMIAEKSTTVVDRTSVLNDVEVLHPFRDTELMRLSRMIPASLKGRDSGTTKKAVLKRAFEDVLPPEVAQREKRGFPSYYWTNGEIDALKRRLLSTAALERTGLFREDAVRRILAADASSSAKSAGKPTWGLLMTQAWHRLHIQESDPALEG